MQIIERTHRVQPAIAAIHAGAACGGLVFGRSPVDLNVLMLVVLFTLLRVKAWFDDEAYFEAVDREVFPGGISHRLGMFLTAASWIAWTFAGLHLKDLELCPLFLAIVSGISTLWIVAAMVRRGACAEQVSRLCLNGFYSLGFLLLYWRDAAWNPFNQHLSGFTMSALALLLFLFLIDLRSRQGRGNRRSRRSSTGSVE